MCTVCSVRTYVSVLIVPAMLCYLCVGSFCILNAPSVFVLMLCERRSYNLIVCNVLHIHAIPAMICGVLVAATIH